MVQKGNLHSRSNIGETPANVDQIQTKGIATVVMTILKNDIESEIS